jgi:hypothetical protein
MREEMLAMDGRLNRLLDRYELMAQPMQKEVVIGNPHLFLTREVEINSRILNTQAEEIRHVSTCPLRSRIRNAHCRRKTTWWN